MPAAPTLYGRPGTYVNESLLPNPPASVINSPSTAAFVGEHWFGVPGVAWECNSWADFVRYLGGFNPSTVPVLANPYLAYAVAEFFVNGGGTAYVSRVVPTANAGVAASITLADQQATPQSTLQLTAGTLGQIGNIGTWGNSMYVDVIAGSASGRFGLNIYKGGYSASYIVERWLDLSMASNDPRYAPSVINNPSSGSMFVVATDMGDTAAFPNNAPKLVNGTQFAGGLDVATGQTYVGPSTADRVAAVTWAQTPPAPLDLVPGVLNINMPGEVAPTVVAALQAYAQNRPYSFAVLDPPSGETPSAAITYAEGLVASQFSAVYYPWVQARDPSSANLQASKLLPPGGFILGAMAAMDNLRGPWYAPAGLALPIAGALLAERKLAPMDLSNLNLALVNTIRTMPDNSLRIWGTRTLQPGFATIYVPVRRSLNYIESSLSEILETFLFAPNDALTWSNVSNAATAFLQALFNSGAFPGADAASSFYVICDDTINTPTTVASGVLNCDVGLALIEPTEFIVLNVQQMQTTGTTTVNVAGGQIAA